MTAPLGPPSPDDRHMALAWEAVARLEAAWSRGDAAASAVWALHADDHPIVLAALIKADLRRRFNLGENPTLREYLDRFSRLAQDSERVVSLAYDEFCLREEKGEAPDPDAFCLAYATWGDSLASQLGYHHLLRQLAGGQRTPPNYPALGDRFQQFRLRDFLGKGGSAVVYLADDEALGLRPTAVKISADRGEEPEIMGRLDHPRIVPVHSVVRDPESRLRGLCMPYRPGLPLNLVLERMAPTPPARRKALDLLLAATPAGRPAPPDGDGWKGYPADGTYSQAVAWFGAAVADALHHAHERDILHRDIKPANILISLNEGPQLLDFNLAHAQGSSPESAEEAHRGGTLPYMAPEQLDAFLDEGRWDAVGRAADIYSLGLVLREMLVGERPEAPHADISMPRALVELRGWRGQLPGPISKKNRAVSPGLEAIIRKCLDPNPARRFPDAGALAGDLRRLISREPFRHARNPSPRERLNHWAHRNRGRLVATALGLAVAASLGQVAWDEYRKSPWRRGAEFVAAGETAKAEDELIKARALGGPVPSGGHALVARLRTHRRDQAAFIAGSRPIDAEAHRAHADRAIQLGYKLDGSDVTEWLLVANSLLARPGKGPADLGLAARYLDEVEGLESGGHRLLQVRGVLASKLGSNREAVDYFRRALAAPSLLRERREVEVAILRDLATSLGKLDRHEEAFAEAGRAWSLVEAGEGYSSSEARADDRFTIAFHLGKLHIGVANQYVKRSRELFKTPAGLSLGLSPRDPSRGALLEEVIRLDSAAYASQDESLRWTDLALEHPGHDAAMVRSAREFRERLAAQARAPRIRPARPELLAAE